ncbi:hypothetical protein GCM10009526_23820 [Glutamicibacter creatinolyticus]
MTENLDLTQLREELRTHAGLGWDHQPVAFKVLDALINRTEDAERRLAAAVERKEIYLRKIHRARELHNANGYRHFGRLPGQPLPEPAGEEYCTHCRKTAPCPTARALDGGE